MDNSGQLLFWRIMFAYFITHAENSKNNEEKMYLEMLQDFIKQFRISDAKNP